MTRVRTTSVCALCFASEGLGLVKLPPEVPTDPHHQDHAGVDEGEDQALLQLLVHDIVEDAVDFPEVNRLLDITQLGLPVGCLHLLSCFGFAHYCQRRLLLTLDNLVQGKQLFD